MFVCSRELWPSLFVCLSPTVVHSAEYFVLIFFLIFAQNIDRGYTLEPPRRGVSNEYPQFMFWTKDKKILVGIPLQTPVFPNKSGFEGVIIAWSFS